MISLRKGKVAVAKWQLRGVGQTFKFVFEKSESFTPASSTPQKKGLLASLKTNMLTSDNTKPVFHQSKSAYSLEGKL